MENNEKKPEANQIIEDGELEQVSGGTFTLTSAQVAALRAGTLSNNWRFALCW